MIAYFVFFCGGAGRRQGGSVRKLTVGLNEKCGGDEGIGIYARYLRKSLNLCHFCWRETLRLKVIFNGFSQVSTEQDSKKTSFLPAFR